MKRYTTTHMIRMEHLNHHGNLYAGRGIEWMIETCYIVAQCEHGNPDGLLYKNTHKFDFMKPVKPGNIVKYEGVLVRAGKTSLTVHVNLLNQVTGEVHAEGYATFVTIDPETKKPVAHGITLDLPEDELESSWREEANRFFNK